MLCIGLGHALPSTKEEWEALHPDKVFETDKDLVLPGYAGQGRVRSHVCIESLIHLMYVCMSRGVAAGSGGGRRSGRGGGGHGRRDQ